MFFPVRCAKQRAAISQSPIRNSSCHWRMSPLKPRALGNFEGRDQASLDLLAAFSGVLAIGPVFPARPVEVSSKFVVLAGVQLGQELLDVLLNLGEFRNERLSVHLSCNITISPTL
jgi:hypothetical protein